MSCTKSVATDLSMVDISNLEGLQTELTQLRMLVVTLEDRLKWKEQGESQKELSHEDLGLKHEDIDVELQILDAVSLVAVFKDELNSEQRTSTGQNGRERSLIEGLEDELSLTVHVNGQTTTEIQEAVCENEKQLMLQELEEGSLQREHEANTVQMSNTVFSGEDQQTQLKMCSVKLLDCKKLINPDNHVYTNVPRQLLPSNENRCINGEKIQKKGMSRRGKPQKSSSSSLHFNRHGKQNRRRSCPCSECGKFYQWSDLKAHIKEKAHKCSKCSKSFRTATRILQRIHIGEKSYQCIQCHKAFTCSEYLRKHQRIHTGETYKCALCGKWFSSPSSLLQHQRIHTGEKPYQCSQCGKAFSQSSNLKTHQRVHTGEKPHQCSRCRKTFSHLSSLKKHQRLHTGEKPYQCSQCGKTFPCSSNLKKHQRLHTGEKPYQCSQCGKTFPQSSNLKTHQQVHTGEKPYQCSQCWKAFSQSSNLKTHQRVHTGEKPYQCSQCWKAFSQSANLKKHQRVHTGEKPY